MANYIDNKQFENLIQKYMSGNKEVEEELFSLFGTLITNIQNGFKFQIEADDAKQECFLLILKVLKNFNKENGAAFNYFTTIILNNLRFLYTKNKNYKKKIESYTLHKQGIFSPSSY